MPFTPTYQNVKPTVGGSADTWGGTNNDRISEAYVDFTAAASVINATETLALNALPKAGGTTTGDVVLFAGEPTGVTSVGFRGAPVVSISASTTLNLTHSGKTIRNTAGSNITVTVPPSGSVGFPVGTAIVLRNYASFTMSVARGAGVTLHIPSSTGNANRTIGIHGMATLLKEDTNTWVLSGSGVS